MCNSVGFTPCAVNGLPTGRQAQSQNSKFVAPNFFNFIRSCAVVWHITPTEHTILHTVFRKYCHRTLTEPWTKFYDARCIQETKTNIFRCKNLPAERWMKWTLRWHASCKVTISNKPSRKGPQQIWDIKLEMLCRCKGSDSSGGHHHPFFPAIDLRVRPAGTAATF